MEDHGEHKHEVHSVANSDSIIKDRAVWDIEIGVKIGKHIIKCGFTEQEKTKEACGYVDCGTKS